MDISTLIQNRYSCRSFAPRAVEQEKIDRILEAGGGVGDDRVQ